MAQKLKLYGRPVTKKNHQRIVRNRKTGQPLVIPSKQYKAYERDALRQLMTYRGPRYKGCVRVSARYYMPNRRGHPDLLGLLQATCDILEAAGIIEDDQLVRDFSGSRIMGVDREDPRVEIEIEPIEEPIQLEEICS